MLFSNRTGRTLPYGMLKDKEQGHAVAEEPRRSRCICTTRASRSSQDYSSNYFLFQQRKFPNKDRKPHGNDSFAETTRPSVQTPQLSNIHGSPAPLRWIPDVPTFPVLNPSPKPPSWTSWGFSLSCWKGWLAQNTGFCLDWSFAASPSPLSSLSLTPETFSNPHSDSLTHNTTEQQPPIFLGRWRGCKARLQHLIPQLGHTQTSCFLHRRSALLFINHFENREQSFKVSHL